MLPRILTPPNEPTDRVVRPRVILGPPQAGEREDVFQGVLLDKAMHRRKLLDWLISLGVHMAVIAALVVVPILFAQRIDISRYQMTYLLAPPPTIAPPPPIVAPHQAQRQPNTSVANLNLPISIPKSIRKSHSPSQPPAPPDLSSAVADGVAGGVPGGVLGGTLGGTATVIPPPPPPVAAVASNKPLQVGGEVKPPQLLYNPPPEYPWLARQAEIQGVVQIDAIVDKNGSIIKMHALDGPPLLIAAALKAVGQWKYQPTYLNGVPYPVELTVDVTFHLS